MIRWLFIGLLISHICWASTSSKPTKVLMGIFPTSIHELNYADESYKISFYLWVITEDPNYDPRKSLEITNSFDYKFKNYDKSKQPDGKYLHVMHFYTTNYHNWEVVNFPFDTQNLVVRVEDAQNIDSIVFVADTEQSALSNEFQLDDWKILGLKVKSRIHVYNSSLGAYDGKRDKYSQFMGILTIERHGARLFFTFYIGFIVSFLISAFVFFIEPSEIRPRASFTLAALFGAVGNKYIIDRFLPVVDHFTLNDAMQVSAFGLILTTAFTTITTYHIQKTSPKRAEKINKYAGFISVPFFVIFYLLFFIRALVT